MEPRFDSCRNLTILNRIACENFMLRKALHKSSYVLIAVLFLGSALGSFAQTSTPFSINNSPLPAPTAPVNDYVGVMDAADIAALNKELIAFKKTQNVEFGVAIIRTTGGRDITDYSLAVARGWGIGSKDQDNPGALLLVAIDDRKYFTQISRDLEDEITDGIAGSIQRQYLVPEFKQQNYSKGVVDTMHAYMARVEAVRNGTAQPATQEPENGDSDSDAGGFSFICLLIIVVFIFFSIWANRNNKGGGGGSGGSALPWIIGSILSSGGGGSSGSSWSGGSDWGGSSGGGGWGGFGGGGDFGGGGAGGGW